MDYNEYGSDNYESNGVNINGSESENESESPLIEQIEAGSVSGVRTALAAKANPNKVYDTKGNTALHIATLQEEINVEILYSLLEAGANPNILNASNMLPLNYAIQSNNSGAIHALLNGTDMNKLRISPLTAVAGNGNLELLKYLLDFAKTVDDKDANGYTALMAAANNGHADIVDYLLQTRITIQDGDSYLKPANVNAQDYDGNTALMLAITSDNDTRMVVDTLVRNDRTTINIQNRAGDTALMLAVQTGNGELVELLIKSGASQRIKNDAGETAFMIAVQTGSVKLLEFLIRAGADINATNKAGETAFEQFLQYMATQESIDDRMFETAEFLLESGADNTYAVRIAIHAKDKSLLEFLLFMKAPISEDDIHAVIDKDDEVVLNMFIENGIPITDDHAKYAIQKNAYKTLELMIPRINLDNLVFPTFSSSLFNEGFAKLLLERHRYSANKHDASGRTLLSHAAETGSVKAVRFLLERGADPTLADGVYGRTPLYYALTKDRMDVAKLLSDELAAADVSMDDLTIQTAREMPPSTPVVKFILDQVKTLWKGWEPSDSEFFDAVLDTSPVVGGRSSAENVSFCPICFTKSIRTEGCMYMNHDCSTTGHYYNRNLYAKYKTGDGKVYWCTLCGRPAHTESGHYHYNILDISVTPKRADLHPHPMVVNYYGGFADCKAQGGGGHEEKVARSYAVMQKARELQSKIGVMFHEDAMDELVKAGWNAPTLPAMMDNAKARIEAGKWDFDHAKEFARTANANATALALEHRHIVYPFSHLPSLMPTIDEHPGNNIVAVEFDVPICRFHHAVDYDADKKLVINTHSGEEEGIGVAGILSAIKKPSSDSSFGYCWNYPTCKARLYPEEVRPLLIQDPILPELYMMDRYATAAEAANASMPITVPTKAELSAILTTYEREFDNKFGMIKKSAAGMLGGAIFQSTPVPATPACPLRKGGRRKTYKRRRNYRRKTRYRRHRA